MALVQFIDDSAPYLSADNLNNNFNYLDDKIDGIIDSGSTANEKYIKYSDGTMIQWGKVSLTPSTSRSQGGLTYYSAATTITLPQEYVDTNYIGTTNVALANMNYFAQSYFSVVDKSTISICLANTGNGDTRTVHWMTIGKWK